MIYIYRIEYVYISTAHLLWQSMYSRLIKIKHLETHSSKIFFVTAVCTVLLGLDLKHVFLSQRAVNLVKKTDMYIKKYNYCKICSKYNMQ